MDAEYVAFRWIHGVVLVFLMFVANSIFEILGITMSFSFGGESFSLLIFFVLGIFLMPAIYGTLSAGLSDLLGDANFPDEIGSKDLVMLWVHGLVLSVVMIVITAFFLIFGLSLSLSLLLTAVGNLVALLIAFISFAVLGIISGFLSHELTELFHP